MQAVLEKPAAPAVVSTMDVRLFFKPMHLAIAGMMRVVQMAQRDSSHGVDQKNSNKPDGTNVTITDYNSEMVAIAALEGLPVFAEERGLVGAKHERYEILIDPLDGTRPFLNGAPTSTCILGLYDHIKKQVVGCLVGEPVSGRVWGYLPGMEGPKVWYLNNPDGTPMKVFAGEVGPKTTVYADFYPGFTKPGSHSFTNVEQQILFSRLFGEVCAISMFGSNAIHHALVAMGDKHDVAGAITSCLGGPWDVAPVILVHAAGGCVRGFTRNDGVFDEVDGLDIKAHHFTISGNNRATVGKLVDEMVTLP
jgi:fructose-1,6-bisphosphatase/inositol monophosphatase family enzyme